MTNEIETVIHSEDGVRVSIDAWDEGGVWLSLQRRGASMHTTFTREEAEKIMIGLQAILAQETTA
jgi:hypothetical protein